jgi:hypothetical protein
VPADRRLAKTQTPYKPIPFTLVYLFQTAAPHMHPDTVLFKTPLGQREMAKQAVLHSRALRNVLLLVDGKRDLRNLQDMLRAMSAPADAIEQLLALGLIAAHAEHATASDDAVRASDRFLHVDDELPSELAVDTRAAVDEDPAESFSSLYRRLNALVSGHLGMIKAYGLQLKIEQCQTSDELLALLLEIKAALQAKHGQAQAAALLRQIEA